MREQIGKYEFAYQSFTVNVILEKSVQEETVKIHAIAEIESEEFSETISHKYSTDDGWLKYILVKSWTHHPVMVALSHNKQIANYIESRNENFDKSSFLEIANKSAQGHLKGFSTY